MSATILIPARFQSTRYPGKPLVELKGAGGVAKPLIQRSFEAASRISGVDRGRGGHRRRAHCPHAAQASARR